MSDPPTTEYWRSIEELLGHPDSTGEFPEGADEQETVSRRGFMSLLGASAALAGLGSCAQEPREKILPYSRTPPEVTPGKELHYATSMMLDGYATGLLVSAREGRPIKIEGNPEHPASLGATGTVHQAALLQLYDPQRGRGVLRRGQPAAYADFVRAFSPNDGVKTRVLMEPTSSPLVGSMVEQRVVKTYFHAPVDMLQPTKAMRSASGEALHPVYDLSKARVIVSLGSDFLNTVTPFSLRYARQFADGRRVSSPDSAMNRLYVVESGLTVTGMSADERMVRKPSELAAFAAALLGAVTPLSELRPAIKEVSRRESNRAQVQAVALDLIAHKGACAVVVGDEQPRALQVLALLLNRALGNVSRTVRYVRSPIIEAESVSHDLRGLVDELRAGAVERLVILGGNPAYSAPADWELKELIAKVPHSAHVGLFANETTAQTEWFVPAAHFLESWGDGRAVDGTTSIAQPLISPLFGGHAEIEVLSALLGQPEASAYQLVKAFWTPRLASRGQSWEQAVQRGVIEGSAEQEVTPRIDWSAVETLLEEQAHDTDPIEVRWVSDAKVHDGCFANNAWLQELPDPVTKQTWGNAAWMSPATAKKLGVESGRHVRLSRARRSIDVPALVVPGHADDTVTLPLGYGRSGGSEELARVGVDAFRLRTSDALVAGTATIEVLETREELAITQSHWSMEGRPIALSRTLDDFRKHPKGETNREPIHSLYEFHAAPPYQWGMAIDLSVCTGCSSCVVACQAENNLPVVGKAGVMKSREMHWLRIDRYFTGSPEAPGVVTQPMLCQHCEKAPCEYVCPVNATTHSPDGLNEMTYNRCVGTRFCQNNCPYKVRRFNWFNYNAQKPPTLKMLMNPQVTVRARGVIEKCTFCVQRIRTAQIKAAIEQRQLRDGEVKTACQMACPTGAIVFGNVADPESEVSKHQARPQVYSVLEELGTKPRVRYLARIRNTATAAEER